jgi:predicted exporter
MKHKARWVVGLWLSFMLCCALLISQTRISTDMSAFLPQHPNAAQQLLVDQLRDGAVSRMLLLGIEGSDPQTRAVLSRTLATRLQRDGQFTAINNGDSSGFERDRTLLYKQRYLLSSRVTAANFSPEGLHASLAESIELLASPLGMMVKPLLLHDPSGEMVHLLEQLNAGSHPAMTEGVWASPDLQRAMLLVYTRASGADIDAQQQALVTLRQAFSKAQAELGPRAASAHLLLSGPGAFAVASRSAIEHSALRLSLLGIVLVISLLLLLYRSCTALLLGMLPVLTGALAGMAAVSLGFGAIHGITLGFGATLIGEAVDYSIYLFVQSESQQRSHWVRDFWPTIRLGVATSVLGFASLLLSGFPGLAQLGLYSIAGLIAAALVTRFVLPVLLPAQLVIRDVTPLGLRLVRLTLRARALRPWACGLTVCAIVVLAVHHQSIWNHQLSALSPIPSADLALDARLRADLGAPDAQLMLVIPANSQEAVLQAAERLAPGLQSLVDTGALGGFDSPARFLPSQSTQLARRTALPDPETLRARLLTACRDLPIKPERLGGFISDVAAARSAILLDRTSFRGTSQALALDAMLQEQGGHWQALLPLHPPATGLIDTVRLRAALNVVPGAVLLDIKHETDTLYSAYLYRAMTLALAGLLAIALLLLWVLRPASRVVAVVLPLGMTVLLVCAALVLAGQQLTILHLVGMLLIVAVGSNYALFFDRPADASEARTLASLLFANLATVAGFGIMAFSSVPVLQALGITVGPGAILALLLSAIMARRCKS